MTGDRLPPSVTPPPPEALKQKLGPIAPVRTRRPGFTLGVVALICLLWGALPFLVHRVRPDLPWLPAWWLAAMGAVWLLAFAAALRSAIVPARGQVLPDGRAAERTAFAVALGVVAVTALLSGESPGHSLPSPAEDFWLIAWHCARLSLVIGAGVIAVVLIASRRLLPYLSWRLGAAIGAAGGALGGLALHFLCGHADAAHVTAGHAGGLVLGTLLGAVVARAVAGRSRETRPPART